MITVKASKTTKYLYVEVDGHAGFANVGQDIVCAAASMLYQAFLKVTDDAGLIASEWDDNVSAVRVIRCEESESWYEMMMAGFELLEDEYSEFVHVQGRNENG